MPDSTRSRQGSLRFGLFELDPVSLDLERAGRPVRLQPQPAKILAFLARHPGRVVTRRELQHHIWGDTYVDAEAGLNACIRIIRATLGDRALAPTYVETLPRRGYRFIAPVEIVGSEAAPPPAAADPLEVEDTAHTVEATRAGRRPRGWTAFGLAAAALVVVAGALSWRSLPPEIAAQTASREPSTVASAAREAVLEARYLLQQNDRKDTARAGERARRAVELEPAWGEAWLVLGEALLADRAPPKETMPAAREAFKTALRHDPTLAAAHAGLGLVHLSYDWDFPAARRELSRAEQLGGKTADLHQHWAFYYLAGQRPELALEHLNRAVELDPVSARIHADVGYVYALLGDHDQAIEQCLKGLELEPELAWLHGCLVESYRAQGRLDLAAQAARQEIAARDQDAQPPARTADPAAVLRFLDRWRVSRLEAARHERYVPACAVGARQAQAGQLDAAIRELQVAFEERSSFMLFMELSPAIAPLRDHPEFRELARRVRSQVKASGDDGNLTPAA